AAAEAATSLAFDRAARLYRMALALSAPEHQARLYGQLGEALANGGRGGEAAGAFLNAAAQSEGDVAHDFLRLASEHLLFSGRFDEGVTALYEVLRPLGVSLSTTPRRALFSLVWQRAKIRLRGNIERPTGRTPSPEQLRRLDIYHSAAVSIGLSDIIRGAELQARHFLLAREVGDAFRLTRAVCAEVAFASASPSSRHRIDTLLPLARELAAESGELKAEAWAHGAEAFVNFQLGRWRTSHDCFVRSEELLRRCTNVRWELATSQIHRLFSLGYLGNLGEAARAGRQCLREAEERGDLYADTMLRLVLTTALLAEDRVDETERSIATALGQWSHSGFHLQHFHAMHGRVRARLYTGDVRGAQQAIDDVAAPLSRSLILRAQITRLVALGTRAQAALAMAREHDGSERRRWVAAARRAVTAMRKERMSWALAVADIYAAALATLDGRNDEGIALLAAAETALAAEEMVLHAAVARSRRGQLVGGDEGRALRDAGERDVRAAGFVVPARGIALYAPGFPD
ncbi:MAG: Serine/threonine-protein kinase PknA, partial [bacterium]|nr:Serine/threonine-protein kinase PknA [bacterium]